MCISTVWEAMIESSIVILRALMHHVVLAKRFDGNSNTIQFKDTFEK